MNTNSGAAIKREAFGKRTVHTPDTGSGFPVTASYTYAFGFRWHLFTELSFSFSTEVPEGSVVTAKG